MPKDKNLLWSCLPDQKPDSSRTGSSSLIQKPYATAKNGDHKARTETLSGSKPEWKEEKELVIDNTNPIIKVKVKDRNTTIGIISLVNRTVGEVDINLNEIQVMNGKPVQDYFSLVF